MKRKSTVQGLTRQKLRGRWKPLLNPFSKNARLARKIHEFMGKADIEQHLTRPIKSKHLLEEARYGERRYAYHDKKGNLVATAKIMPVRWIDKKVFTEYFENPKPEQINWHRQWGLRKIDLLAQDFEGKPPHKWIADQHTFEIANLLIDPQLRGQKKGLAIMREMEEIARRRGCKVALGQIRWGNGAARKLFVEKLGYTPVMEATHIGVEQGGYTVLMKKIGVTE